MTDETARAVATAAKALSDAGLICEERRPPHVERGNEMWLKLFSRASVVQLRKVYTGREREGGSFVSWRLATADDNPPPALDVYIADWMERDRLREELVEWMQTTPIIVAPVGATPAYAHDTLKVNVNGVTMGTFQSVQLRANIQRFRPACRHGAGGTNEMTGCRSEFRLWDGLLRRRWYWRLRKSWRGHFSAILICAICIICVICGWESIMEPVLQFWLFSSSDFIAIVLLVIAAKTIRIVPQATVMLVERLGKFDKVASSGLNILVPFLDKPRAVYWTNTRPGVTSIDLREQYIDLPPQPVITRDNVTIHVDSVVYWQITDPVKAVYEMNDLVGGIVQLTITGMRAVMGDMDLDHTLSQRDQINSKLRLILDEATDKWGVKVTRVDVKNINPPEDVRITMEKQMTAERNRRALVLQAEGDRQAAITRAEGEKQAAVTRAEGEKQSAILAAEGAAQARLRNAEAESEAINRIAQAIPGGDPGQYLITTRYIDSLRDMTRTSNSKVIFMPVETSAMLSSVGAIKEVLSQTGERDDKEQLPPPRPRELPR